jgi:formate dehydrogenase assembly factor FdhD
MDNVERVPIQRATKEDKNDTEDIVIKELPLTIILNNQEL